jgi:hypothetical protein
MPVFFLFFCFLPFFFFFSFADTHHYPPFHFFFFFFSFFSFRSPPQGPTVPFFCVGGLVPAGRKITASGGLVGVRVSAVFVVSWSCERVAPGR